MLSVICLDDAGETARTVALDALVIAGWTGRDRQAVEAHIAELERLGVARPSSTPVFYRAAASLLTTAARIEVLGPHTSGEVEVVILALDDGLWVGVGSDHTDRKAEVTGVALSKQLCPKPIGPRLWRLPDVAPHWDELELSSHVIVGGKRRLYQRGKVSAQLPPHELARRWRDDGLPGLPVGTAMFCGTLPVKGEIGPAETWELSLTDPRRGKVLTHRYAVRTLPVVA